MEPRWGPDVIWCEYVKEKFKSPHPCVLSRFTPIIHLNSKSQPKSKTLDFEHLNAYKEKYKKYSKHKSQRKVPISYFDIEKIINNSSLSEL